MRGSKSKEGVTRKRLPFMRSLQAPEMSADFSQVPSKLRKNFAMMQNLQKIVVLGLQSGGYVRAENRKMTL